MTENDRYTWLGIEKPFPWVFVLWPVLWIGCALRDLFGNRRIYTKRGPMGEPVPVVLRPWRR